MDKVLPTDMQAHALAQKDVTDLQEKMIYAQRALQYVSELLRRTYSLTEHDKVAPDGTIHRGGAIEQK